MGEADPPFFGYVEFAALFPVVGFEEVGAGVFGRDGDGADLLGFEGFGLDEGEIVWVVFGELGPIVDRVFLALECPGLFPFGAFAESGGFVAEDGEMGDAGGFDEVVDEGLEVGVGCFAVEGGDLEELGVAVGEVGEGAGGGEGEAFELAGGVGFGVHASVEVEVGFEAIEEPGMQGPIELGVPGFGVPAAFVFGLFDEGDIGVGFDRFDAALDELFVIVRPFFWEFGDGSAFMAFKPGCF